MKYGEADALFATGFKSGLLAEGLTVGFGGDGNRCRPSAALPGPLGRAQGDAAYEVSPASSSSKSVLVIAERECSAPGNERSLIKWQLAAVNNCQVETLINGHVTQRPLEKAVVVLAFACTNIPAHFGSITEYRRTKEFCDQLARQSRQHRGLTAVAIWLPDEMTDWTTAGQQLAEQFYRRDDWRHLLN